MKFLLSMALLALSSGHAHAAPPKTGKPAEAAMAGIDGERLLEHITMLASDEFEGRAPGTRGETVTLDYLQQQFKKLGLEPGNPDGTYLQAVPLVAISSHPTLSYVKDGQAKQLTFGDDYVAWTARTEKKVEIANSELVFVGYGVQAPEFQWDDYKGVDLKGKTLVMLINDPQLADPKRPKQLDPAMFGGSAITRYGRWNYKFEMAAKLGAAGALIVHETKPATYPYEVVRNSWGRENFAIKSKTPDPAFPAIPGWLQGDRARELFKAAGQDFDALKQQALQRNFHPVPLGVKLNVTALNAWREVASHNVVAKIPGSDPLLKNEVVVYTAHWDHFGIDESLPGPRTQQIFHGAMDNATGVAALLEIARAYKALPVAPKRTIVFVLTTAEERGLLGAQYYARNPLYPLSKTLLNINVDGLNMWGRTRDVELSGMGKSSADDIVAGIARSQGRSVRPDSNADYGSFYRGDQFEFARGGVPVVYLRSSSNFIGKAAGYGREKLLNYSAHQYHTVNDTVQAKWDTSGAVEDIELLFKTGYQTAQGKDRPQWKDNAEFKR
ncbi:M20/M25/M40 family metallo-hydrolase [Duganella sp. HH105]|uniref:M20/M25/M40 family metallo-hydrolase n=1 Tax=Duganella sp. HH105 TaxID=1781067 RepID=UPI000877C702|nr:M20/M25/M40 family metallo-hydrolase [Duganella sp. HH105]OEZ56314.1 alkaline phosphatase isozyme conversion aminopeptidase [Duganella sp. HH105]